MVVVVALVVGGLLLSAGVRLLSAGGLLLSAGGLLLSAGGLLLSAGGLLLSAGGLLLRGPYFLWGPYFPEVFSLLHELGAPYRRKTYIFGIRETKRFF